VTIPLHVGSRRMPGGQTGRQHDLYRVLAQQQRALAGQAGLGSALAVYLQAERVPEVERRLPSVAHVQFDVVNPVDLHYANSSLLMSRPVGVVAVPRSRLTF